MLGLGVFSQVSVFLKSLPLPVQNTPQSPNFERSLERKLFFFETLSCGPREIYV